MIIRKLPLLIAASLLLNACSSALDGKSPAELVRYSMKRQITHDNQYEFSGQTYLDWEQASVQAASEPAADMPAEIAALAAAMGEHSFEKDLKAEKHLKSTVLNLMKGYTKAISIPYSGSVDLPHSKMELVPSIQVKTRNSLSYAKVPMQIDWQEGALYADVEAVSYWTDLLTEGLGWHSLTIGDRYLALKLPKGWQQKVPMQRLAAALPDAVEQSYAAVPAERFQRLEMNDEGRRLKAAYRISSSLSLRDYQKMGEAQATSLHRTLSAQQPPEGISAADYQKTVSFLKKLAEVYRKPINVFDLFKDDLSNEASEEVRQAVAAAEQAAQQAEAKFASEKEKEDDDKFAEILDKFKVESELFFDKKGRLLAVNSRLNLLEDPEMAQKWLGEKSKLNLYNRYTVRYTPQPSFVIRPQADNVLDLSCVLTDIDQCAFMKEIKEQKDKEADSSAESDEGEWLQPVYTEKPKSKKRRSKAPQRKRK